MLFDHNPLFLRVLGFLFLSAFCQSGCIETDPPRYYLNSEDTPSMENADGVTEDTRPFVELKSIFREAFDDRTSSLPFPYNIRTENSFTIVMLPDTQLYIREPAPEYFEAQIDWILAHRESLNIQLVAHVGDIVHHYDEDENEWKLAKSIMNELSTHDMPYVITPGNHDYVHDTRDSTMFNEYFPIEEFSEMATFGGAFEDDKSDNTYHFAGNESFPILVLAIEFGARDRVLDWIEEVSEQYQTHHILMVTHGYLYTDDSRIDADNSKNPEDRLENETDVNNPEVMWDDVIKHQENIFMVLCGHTGSDDDPVANRLSENHAGKKVYQQMLNYQRFPLEDNGYFKILQFIPENDMIIASSFSPYMDQFDPREETQMVIVDEDLFND